MKFIRQNATHKIVCGPAVAVGDGFTPVTTLALSSADEAEVILHDNGTVVDISGYTWAAITTADGYYHLTLQSGISGTVGHVTVVVNDDSLCLPLREDFTVLEEAVYDALFAASAPGYLQPTTAGRTLDVSAGGEAGVDWANVGSPTTTVALTNTSTASTGSVTNDVNGNLVGNVGGNVNGNVAGSVASVTAGVTLANGAITDASLAGNMEIVFETDFATNYDTTNDRWRVDVKTWNNLTTVALPLVPTTAGRTLDVSTGGEAGIDWGNIGNMTSLVALTNTGIGSVTLVVTTTDVTNLHADAATAAAQTTAQNDLDILTGTDGVTLATSQPNYAPSTAAALASLVTTVGAAGAGLTEAGGTGDHLTAIPAAILDLAAGVETGLTLRQAMRLIAAAAAGKISGAATTTVVIRNAVADAKDRITATVDADGNRSAITVDLT